MRRFAFVLLALLLILGTPTMRYTAWAQDDEISSEGSSEGAGDAKENGESGDSGDGENKDADSGDKEGGEEEKAEEGKTYVCPQCGYSSDEPGDCPGCNVPLVEEKEGGSETEGSSGTDTGAGTESGSDGGSGTEGGSGGDY